MSSDRNPSFASVIQSAISKRLADVHTAIPGAVESYDVATQRVNVKPQVRGPTKNPDTGAWEYLPIAVIQSVPVQFPGAGDFRMTFPIAKGDTGLIIFSEASIERWLEVGHDVSADDVRKHHVSDAIFIPGLNPKGNAWPGDNAAMTIGSVDGAEDWVARATAVVDVLEELKTELAAWTVVPNDGGLALWTRLQALFAKGWPYDAIPSATVKIKG